jgi:NTP pyrophosphatase (non-canonical NTP hydrolase)
MKTHTRTALESLITRSDLKYGPYRSTHEALGVIAEEFDELLRAIRYNDAEAIADEAIDVAAACIRLADAATEPTPAFADRSSL